MKRLFLLLSLSIWIFISCQKQAQLNELNNYKLFVTLENAPFDSLYLYDYTGDRDIYIAGKKTQKFTWEITIPDSIALDYEAISLESFKRNLFNDSYSTVRFITENNGKKVIIANIGVEEKENYIHAIYIGKTIFSNEYFSIKIGNQDSTLLGDNICEDFKLILKNDSSDITIRAQDPFFSWFINLDNENISYDEYLARYIELSKRYPDSRFLMCNLSKTLNRYKSKKDVQAVYNNFSNKHKNTHWAKNIERFLYNKFQNTSLLILDKSRYEDIVQDTSKYNLLIFTASWCRPCLDEIPVLKEINNVLNKKLNMTYISLDEENTVESFQNLMQKKDIQWRALLAFNDIQGIEKKYFINGIPQCILIYPNGNMDMIDVRKKEDNEKLYSLCGK